MVLTKRTILTTALFLLSLAAVASAQPAPSGPTSVIVTSGTVTFTNTHIQLDASTAVIGHVICDSGCTGGGGGGTVDQGAAGVSPWLVAGTVSFSNTTLAVTNAGTFAVQCTSGCSAGTPGQTTMAASSPVVIASDQSAVAVSNANLDAALSTLATGGKQDTGNASLATIKTNTDNLATIVTNTTSIATAARQDTIISATHLEDSAFADGDRGAAILAVRQDAPGSQVTATGDYEMLQLFQGWLRAQLAAVNPQGNTTPLQTDGGGNLLVSTGPATLGTKPILALPCNALRRTNCR